MLTNRVTSSAVFSCILLLALTFGCQAQWVKMDVPCIGQIRPVAVIGTQLFIKTTVGVFRSSDCGANWTAANNGLPAPPFSGITQIINFAVSGEKIFASSPPAGAFLSTDDGQSWKAVNAGLGDDSMHVFFVAVCGAYVFAGTVDGMYRSSNNGTNWIPVNGGEGATSICTILVCDTTLLAGTNNGLIRSTDYGKHWGGYGLEGRTAVTALGFAGTDLYAGTVVGAVYRSRDTAASWDSACAGLSTPSMHYVNAIANYGSMVFVGTEGGGVYQSTDRGASWNAFNAGLPNATVWDLAVLDSNLFAGTANGLFRRSLSAATSGDELPSSDEPYTFTLEQNYPNPFNPSTTIRYALPDRAHVTLSVYNTLGQQVASLVDAVQEPGEHSVRFDGSGLASGVYFYRLRAGEYVTTKRLVLVR